MLKALRRLPLSPGVLFQALDTVPSHRLTRFRFSRYIDASLARRATAVRKPDHTKGSL